MNRVRPIDVTANSSVVCFFDTVVFVLSFRSVEQLLRVTFQTYETRITAFDLDRTDFDLLNQLTWTVTLSFTARKPS